MGFSVLQISAVRMFCVFFQNYQGAAPLGWNVASNILQHGRSVKINDKFIYTLCEMRTTKNLHSWIHTPETTYSVCITVVEYLEYIYMYVYASIYIYICCWFWSIYLIDSMHWSLILSTLGSTLQVPFCPSRIQHGLSQFRQLELVQLVHCHDGSQDCSLVASFKIMDMK